MPELVNTKTNALETVSHDEMPKLLQQGSHDLLQEGTTDVLNPNGELVSIPNSQVYQATSQYGYRFPSSQDVQKFQEQKQYGEGAANELSAFAAGAARSASFGLSDQALTKTGAVNPETLSKLAEYNPTATTLGEVTGIAGSLLAAPEVSLVGKAAKAGQAISEGSGAIASTAAKFLANPETAPMASKVLQSVGQVSAKTLGSAVEGAAYGLGQSISEDALGNPAAMGEGLMANIGYGALFGGAIGGALKSAEIAVPAIIHAAKDAITKLRDGIIGTTEDGPGLLTKGIAKVSSFVSGAPEESIANSILERQKTLYGPEEYRQMQNDFIKNMDEVHSSVNQAAKKAAGEIREEEAARLLEGRDNAVPFTEVQKVGIALKDTIDNMEAHPEMYPARFPAKLKLFQDELAKAATSDTPTPQLFKALNDLKQNLDKRIPWEKEIGGEAVDALNDMKNFRTTIKNALEKESVWGEAGARQSAFNDAFSDWITAQKGFRKEFMQKVAGKAGPEYVMKPTKIATYFNQIADARGDIRHAVLDNYVNSSQRLLDEIEKTYQAVPDKTFDKNAVKSVIDKSIAQKQEAFEQAKTVADLRKLQPNIWNQGVSHGGGHEAEGLGIGAVAAHTLGLPMGPLLGAVEGYHMLAHPAKLVQRLAWIERTVNHTAESIEKGIKAALTVTTKTVEPLKGLISQKLTPQERQKKFKEVTGQLNELQNNPQMMMDKLEGATKDLYSYAPQTSQAVSTSMALATGFLASKVPQIPHTGPLQPEYVPSETEIAKFDRYLTAVERPLTVLNELKNGTLTSETVETLQTVYPQLYQQMQSTLLSKLTDAMAKKKNFSLPYKTKLMFSQFLGQDLDGSLQQMSIATNQMILHGAAAEKDAQEAMAQNVKPTSKAIGKIDIADRLKTNMQSTAERNLS